MRKMMGMAAAIALVGGTVQARDNHEAAAGEPLYTDPDAGALTGLTTQMVRDAADLVTQGKVYRLGVVSGPETPVWGERTYAMRVVDLGVNGPNRVTGHDDRVETHLGIGTQIDGLGHIGIDGVHYNGVPAGEIMREDGLVRYGAENIPAIATRGVLIDMAAYRGVEVNEPLDAFSAADVQAAAAAQGVEVRAGDVVVFHTGWQSRLDEPEVFITQAPGIDASAAAWLAEQGVVAVGSDTAGLETNAPSADGSVLPVHAMLIAEHGIYILETINTSELAADEVNEFLFVLGAARLKGSVQAIVNPVAIR
ncbi:cyclase family protein [Aurantiacibacter poecillastricola]|uniref:cyclase family protein n=1 Tax=Aurantiacibacter poecillastricola TaxID=3064385 RepID=UPI00273D64DE|nr:cyclase family protein [Aurantiacibacter sp. 219JJ12-13]MDP5261526.1 cyclase family protein [Aurantiacibacter sp. 219JJ12-13]